MRPSVDAFLNFNPAVGPGQMLVLGYPGTGKTIHGMSMCIQAAKKGEMILTHGDITCEWKHFLNYPKYIKGIKILIPKEAEIFFYLMKENLKHDPLGKIIKVDYNNINIIEYMSPGWVTVVYDDCFKVIDKTLLWTEIFRQLISRKEKIGNTICYLCHEAGIIYPQSASKKQWKAVDAFAELFVYFRKCNIRSMLLAQIENEINDRIRKKCIWRIYRISMPGKHSIGQSIRKYVKRMTRNQYHIFWGDLYVPLNSNPKIKEIKELWRMISTSIITLKGDHISRDVGQNPEIVVEKTMGSQNRIRLGTLEGIQEGDAVRVTIQKLEEATT